MSHLILHHYPSSPFAEKARLMLGFKGLAWQSVHIPMVMPKPAVVALTCRLAGPERLVLITDGVDVAGQHLDFYLLACLTPVFNVASRHPVLNVPSGLAPNGVPTGVQVVARPYDDVTAFHVGAAAERELGIWNDPSWRPSL